MIHVISTTANLEEGYELRKRQYIDGLTAIIQHYEICPYIIESVKKSPYFSEHYIGNFHTHNKGVNEFAHIKEFFELYDSKFDDEDYIIKTTLRYEVNSSCFIDAVRQSEYDIYCKEGKDIYGSHDHSVHTFLVAMRYKCWKEFFATTFDVTSNDPVEWFVAKYARTKNTKFLDYIGITARPASFHGKEFQC